jgi:hypothetical protein
MSAKKTRSRGWPVKAVDPPKLSTTEWVLAAVPGIVLVAMAVLQLISFSDFKNILSSSGLSAPAAWGIGVMIAELWGAAGFFPIRLSVGFRAVSNAFAILAAGFWFVNNLQLVSSGMSDSLQNSGFFGRFLAQSPGWWTVLEVSVLLFWIVYKIGLMRDNTQTTRAAA